MENAAAPAAKLVSSSMSSVRTHESSYYNAESLDHILVVPLDTSNLKFAGFITLDTPIVIQKCCYCEIRFLVDKSLESLELEDFLTSLISPYATILQRKLKTSKTIEAFLQDLQTVLGTIALESQLAGGNVVSKKSTTSATRNTEAAFYTQLVSELDAIGWSYLESVDATQNSLVLVVQDDANRSHSLALRLSCDYPSVPPISCVACTPIDFVIGEEWSPKDCSLKTIVRQFKTFLSQFQQIWNVLDEIDSKTWVLEPENLTRDILSRRIAIAPHASIHFILSPKVSPDKPTVISNVRFFGSDAVIGPLRRRWMENLNSKWNQKNGLYKNLQDILSIRFPSPEKSSKNDFAIECGICYSYHLDGDIAKDISERPVPERVCDNVKCARPFHQICLVEWLRSLPNSHQSFNTTFGTCPYCQESISATTGTL